MINYYDVFPVPVIIYSKISMELFVEIEKNINEKCYFGKDEKIVQFYNDDGKYFCFYVDFVCKNKIIEFYGDYFHGNPKLYKSDKIVGSKYKHYKVEDIWKRDSERVNLIEKKDLKFL